MLNIKSRYIDEETVKLIKKYFKKYEKTINLMQQIILKKKSKFIKK